MRRALGLGHSNETFLRAYAPWNWYWRIRGWGLSFRLSLDKWRSFSERNGYIKVHRWGPIRFQVLRPKNRA